MNPKMIRTLEAALKLLSIQPNSDRLSDIRTLHYNKDITFDSVQNYVRATTTKGFTPTVTKNSTYLVCDRKNDRYLILYDENDKTLDDANLNWLLATHVGHIYLDHSENNKENDIEAYLFAIALMFPFYSTALLQTFSDISDEDISKFMELSIETVVCERDLPIYQKVFKKEKHH